MKAKIKNFINNNLKQITSIAGVGIVTASCILVGFYEPEIDPSLLED